MRRGDLEEIDHLDPPRLVTGVPLTEPLTIEEVLDEADEDGFVTATLAISLEDLVGAARDGSPDVEEHNLLAAKLCPLLPHDSSYVARGVAEDGSLLVDFRTNVRESKATTEDQERWR